MPSSSHVPFSSSMSISTIPLPYPAYAMAWTSSLERPGLLAVGSFLHTPSNKVNLPSESNLPKKGIFIFHFFFFFFFFFDAWMEACHPRSFYSFILRFLSIYLWIYLHSYAF
ncbi:hypothetical protein HMI56_002912 [Coelomomyces lativittatus]|nr:hypothetical protein HMI56_002912 [Coelomomyces lativittatus]